MSAPRTNIDTQRRRHRGPLIGMIAVVVFALGLLLWLTMRTADEGTPQDSNAPQIDGRTGNEVEADPVDPTQPADSGEAAVPATQPPANGSAAP